MDDLCTTGMKPGDYITTPDGAGVKKIYLVLRIYEDLTWEPGKQMRTELFGLATFVKNERGTDGFLNFSTKILEILTVPLETQ